MKSNIVGITWFVALAVAMCARAEDGDLAAGEKLYIAQCKICHGSVSQSEGGAHASSALRLQLVRLAMRQSGGSARADVPISIVSGTNAAALNDAVRAERRSAGEQIAFAPPFGPNLRGVYGRPAGTAKGYEYSSTFLKSLQGMEWNDAALDVWITNPQAWVPGVYMFYKQPDPEVRRKIILYLKANPQ